MVRVLRLLVVAALIDALGGDLARGESPAPAAQIPGQLAPSAGAPTPPAESSARPNLLGPPRGIPEAPAAAAPLASQVRDAEAPRTRPAPPDARVANRGAPAEVEPGTSQVIVGILVGAVVSVIAGKTYFATHGNLGYTAAVFAGGAVGTGAIVCALGQTSPTRHGGCTASLAGALIGALGAVPGLLIARQSAGPCTATGPNADDSCAIGGAVGALVGLTVGGLGYALATGFGARIGWDLGATRRFDPPPAVASLPILTVTF
jgi:hypothetical protein